MTSTLFLCHRLPFPPNKGDKIRSHALLKHLATKGPVHVGCFIDDPQDFQYCDDVQKFAGGKCHFEPIGRSAKIFRALGAFASGCPITTAYFASPRLSQWVSDVVAKERIDHVVIFGSAMAPYLLDDRLLGSRVLFDMVDVDSDKWQQYASASGGPLRWIYAREARAVRKLERRAARAFGRTLLVSPFETETFQALAPECADKVSSLNNGVDLEHFSAGVVPGKLPKDELAIVMTGRMDYRPNYEGALWFAEHVAPRLFSALPEAHIYLVGSGAPSALRKITSPKITVTGAVADVRPYIESAAVVVAPLQIARGVQNKVLEAMAMNKPVVATREATRALAVKSGVHLWVENEPSRFAGAVVNAIRSPERASVMRNARQFVEENHEWKQVFAGLDRHLAQLNAESPVTADRVVPTILSPIASLGLHREEKGGDA